MSGLTDFVKKGVRLIVADEEGANPHVTPAEIPAEALVPPETPPPPAATSSLPAVAEFDDVYVEAGVRVADHGYGVEKVAEMLDNKRLATLTREVKATAVLTALEAAGVPLADVIQDAVRRDQALDAFEAGKKQALEELRADNQARVTAIQQEIEDFLREKNAEIEALKSGTEQAIEAFAQLEARKRREEERLRDVISFFVTPAENPITTETPSAPSVPAGTSDEGAAPPAEAE
jgi:hypothetical protein